MKSSEFITERTSIRSYNKSIVGALQAMGFKVDSRAQSTGVLKTWFQAPNAISLREVVAALTTKFPGTKLEDWGGDLGEEIRGEGFQIEKQGKASIFLAVHAGPKAAEYARGLDEDKGMDAVRAGERVRAKRQARLKAEVEAGRVPIVRNASSLSDDEVYTMGDLEALGWMDKDYHSEMMGPDDVNTTWTRYYHSDAPGPIRVNTSGHLEVWQPGHQEEK